MAGKIPGKMLKDATVTVAKLNVDTDLPMGTHKITGLVDGAASTDAATKGQVDAAIVGLGWQKPVSTKDYIGTQTIAQIDLLSPSAGWTVVAGDAGEPDAGTSDVLAEGDIAEFDGTSWKKIVAAGAGNAPPANTRLLVSGGTLYGPLTDVTDRNKYATFPGSSKTPALVAAADGDALMVAGEASVNENKQWVYDATVWVQFGGSQVVVDGAGLSYSGNTLNVGDAGKGVQVNVDNVEVDAAEIAGVGVEQTPGGGANTCKLRLAAQGNGIAGGAGSTLSVLAETTSVVVGAGGVKAAVPSQSNKNMTANVTTADQQKATNTTVVAAPGGDGDIMVAVDGTLMRVSDDNSGECYFGQGDTVTARAKSAVQAGDTLRWNGTIAGFELDANDKIDFIYTVA